MLKNKDLRILMIVTANSLLDGVNRHILAMASGLNKLDGVSVAICTVFPWGELHKEIVNKGIPAYAMDGSSGHSIKILGRFRKILKEFSPNIIHAHTIPFCVRLYLNIFRKTAKVVVTYHGLGRIGNLERFINRLLYIKIDGCIYVSNGVKDFYQCKNKNIPNHAVIYNPIAICNTKVEKERCKSRELCAELGVLPSQKIIGTACRIAQIKRPLFFIEVMIQVLILNSNVCAVIIGDGDKDLQEQMKARVIKAGLSNRVFFMGYRADARTLISDFDIFVVTSTSEGMPTAVLEAMSSGVPVVFSKGRGGLMDLEKINQEFEFGVFTDSDDLMGMANSINHLLMNDLSKYNRLSSSAQFVCETIFSVDIVSKQVAGFYKQILGVN